MSRGLVLVSAASVARAVPYVAALAAAGVAPESIRVVTADPDESAHMASIAELAAVAAGLVLCGGEDVDPRRYGEEPLPAANVEVSPRRDALEWALLDAARARRVPVWGICRGFQVLNVFFGGSLWQDLLLQRPKDPESTEARESRKASEPTETPEAPKTVAHDPGPPNDRLAHAIRVLAPGAPLGERLAAGGPAPLVNSRHHQGVRHLGAGLLAVAAAPDGLIEAAILSADAGGIGGGTGEPRAEHKRDTDDNGAARETRAARESREAEENRASGENGKRGESGPAGENGAGSRAADGWWVRGVEWHPENLLALPEQMALWRDFAAAVANAGSDGRAGSGGRAGRDSRDAEIAGVSSQHP